MSTQIFRLFNHDLLITGTDTDCGKTYFSRLLIQKLRASGQRVGAMKPVAAGIGPDGQNEDVSILKSVISAPIDTDQICPYCFAEPIAPHIAAQKEKRRIELHKIRSIYHGLKPHFDRMVIEGAGGWLVPLNEKHDMADMALALDLDVILVVGLKLGCLNHAFLSVDSIQARGARLVGWVANQIDPNMAELSANLDSLQKIPAPLLAYLPYGQAAQWF